MAEEVVNYEACETKRQKREENMDGDESLPIIERLKSLREDISNCIGKWRAMNIVEKMAKADNLFNKVQDRVNNLTSRGPSIWLLFSQAKDYQELLHEKEQMEELVALLIEEYLAFKSSHWETYLGEYEDCLWKLYKIEKKTNKISAQIPNMSIECEVYDMIFGLGDVDGEELADFNVADLDYDGLMKQMEDMMERSKECDEVCGYFNELILCVDHIIHTIDGLNEDQQ